MKTLIRRMQSQKGTIAFSNIPLETATVRIGRGTEQDVEIADPRIALAHAEITPMPDGTFRLDAKTPSGVWVNGTPCSARALQVNDILDFGRFRITVMKPEAGSDLTLLVEERADAVEEKPAEIAATRLEETWLSRRRPAWVAFIVVLLAMLLLPLVLRYAGSKDPATQMKMAALPLVPTQTAWNSGPLSSAHAYFETDCAACHVQPFKQVRNNACLACHDAVRHHVPDAAMAALPDFSAAACTDCHREHNGPDGTIVRLASLCTDCHENLQARFPDSTMGKVGDFATHHPPFSPVLTQFDKATRSFKAEPVVQEHGVALREDNGLVFPHNLHLDTKGIDAPDGKRKLECSSCHEPDRGAVGFRAVSMERHCADCHRLEFDPDDPTRVVPHGKPAEVAAVLRDHFAAKALDRQQVKTLGSALPAAPERRRPGPPRTPAEREFIAQWSATQGDAVVREVFEGRLCRYCHVVEPTNDPKLPWDIAPVALQEHALSAAAFTHAPHADTACVDCHAARTSKLSSDVLLPDIGNCRACHGDVGGKKQVTSTCLDCHSYHVDQGVLWDPGATRRKTLGAQRHPKLITPRGAS
ncbi:putative CXXCH cytochrome family protein [Panacagrimonas perspica]|uniref:Putative CXXCH cytochrome family protein n=1 Tax=Panacagrimonas perspica TaxID=381431 RepID=A0A4S3K3I4_9GAMM|nr:cytochrome c3 family protein [Panacagrimonas perspica]TDU31248.1 putative CXXCH cytochrome family protein [Panacagrimonas perspica]THD02597.1 hypothetical protein B1810_13690 [Panacagrimonas perspica]